MSAPVSESSSASSVPTELGARSPAPRLFGATSLVPTEPVLRSAAPRPPPERVSFRTSALLTSLSTMSSEYTVFEPESAAAVPPRDTNRAIIAMISAGDGRRVECMDLSWRQPFTSGALGQPRAENQAVAKARLGERIGIPRGHPQ